MKVSSIKYLVKDGCKNITKNKLMSFASIGVLTACLVLIGSAVLFSMNINVMLNYLKSQNEIVVFMLDETDQATNDTFANEITSNENVLESIYVSKEQALEEQLAQLGDASILLEDLKADNIMPASYRIKLKDISLLPQFNEFLQNRPYVEKVNSPNDVADKLVKIDKMVKLFGTVVISLLVIVSTIIVSNTIKVSVFSRRREINIMKYVGATNTFIRLPFVVEGAVLGIISAIASFLIVHFSYNYVAELMYGPNSILIGTMFNASLNYDDVKFYMLGLFLVFGITTGVVGSVVSSRKHLKV